MDFLYSAVAALLVISAWRAFEYLLDVRLGPSRVVDTTIQNEAAVLSQSTRINILETQTDFLTMKLQEAIKQIGQLEETVYSQSRKISELERENTELKASLPDYSIIPATPLLHISGDLDFGIQDRAQLSRAKISFRSLDGDDATKSEIEKEFQRRRNDGSRFWWVLVSAHGRKNEVILADGPANRYWWNSVVDKKTKLVVFANCDGADVGDAMAGIAERVIIMYGDRPTEDASEFIYALFRALKDGYSADDAYSIAKEQVPQISSYVDIRKS